MGKPQEWPPAEGRSRPTRRQLLVGGGAVGVAAAVGVSLAARSSPPPSPYAPLDVGGFRLPARVQGSYIAAARDRKFVSSFWPGVNLGSTIPGSQPGELAASRDDYDRWLKGMGDLGARVVRVYTISRPVFYDAVLDYNANHPQAPVFVLHGIWLPDEEDFYATGNIYTPAVTNSFDAEIEDAVRVVHGDATLPERPGHASGTYQSDISKWLLGWSAGIEWDPTATHSTDMKNAGINPYVGRYITATSKATPMESWLAARLDHLANQEAQRGWSRPLTFTNWVTCDPLKPHRYEPPDKENLVTIDAKHLAATDRWPGGFFASYHVYPYYPEFLRLTPTYQQYRRPSDGVIDPYSGYLHQLRAHHGDQAVMITEFGVPTGPGIAHLGALGRNQGHHSEQQQGEIDARLARNIHEEKYAGAIVFEWIDEWFKFTWNTQELELPGDRRQMWHNVYTNEAQFGLVAAEPGEKETIVRLDGDGSEWEHNGSQVIATSDRSVREVRAVNDEAYLYLRLRLADESVLTNGRIVVGLDVRDGGNRGLPGLPGVMPSADVAVELGPGRTGRFLQAGWSEPTRIYYGLGLHMFHVDPAQLEANSGAWVTPLQILNKPETVPATGERVAVELFDQSKVVWTDNPHDVLAFAAGKGTIIELRLPYMLLGFSDPSSHKLFIQRADGKVETTDFKRVGIGIYAGDSLLETSGFSWDPWDTVKWHERRKAGFATVAAVMRELSVRI